MDQPIGGTDGVLASHHHTHAHSSEITGRRVGLAIGLTVVFVALEAVVGWRTGSLALLSDAGHNLADGFALVLSAFALWVARRPATEKRTYGFHRVGILVALINSASLVVISLLIFAEALRRIQRPEPVQGAWMIGVALAALAMNVAISLWLRAGARDDLNVRSAYLHMVGDAAASLGVVVAGVVVAATGYGIADPIVSMLIGGLILWSSWGVLRESVEILLEAAPVGIDIGAVQAAIVGVEGVLDVHDLHVWTISSGIHAASCHVVVGEQSVRRGQMIVSAIARDLESRFGITHPTVQIETESCTPVGLRCAMRRTEEHVPPVAAPSAGA